MKSLHAEAKGFVAGVVTQLKKTGKAPGGTAKVQSLLLKMTAKARGEHQAAVESPVKLTTEEERAIARMLSKVSGHEVHVETVINPELIAGIRIQMADWVMDATMRNELQTMATLLTME